MGRPERPLDGVTPVGTLAQRLRSLRERAGVSYRELADSTRYNPSTYSRAAAGDGLPTLEVVELYAQRCGANSAELRELRSLWKAARRARAPKPRTVPLDLIRQPVELCDAMVALRSRVGHPSLRLLEEQAGGYGRLPRSTLSLVLRGLAMPGRTLLEHFVRACGVPSQEIDRWLKAWDRVRASQLSGPAAANLSLLYRDLSMPAAVGGTGEGGRSGWGLRPEPAATAFRSHPG